MLKFDEEKHIYTLNGTVLPSVTQVPGRLAVRSDNDSPWNSLNGSEFFTGDDRAAKFGTEFHKVAALVVQGKEALYDDALTPWINSLYNFLDDENLMDVIKNRKLASIYQVEEKGYSDLGYAGSWDWFFYFQTKSPESGLSFPRCLLIDWKTSTSLHKRTTRMQTAAYRQMIIERNNLRRNLKIPRWTVRIDPPLKRGYEVDKRTTEAEDYINFQSCLNVYKNFI